VLGRHQERGGLLDQTWSAYGPGDVPVLVEQLVLDETAHRPGVLGGHRALGSVVALGVPVAEEVCADGRMDLEHGGSVWRRLAHEAHRAVPADAWRAVVDAC
jgi:urease accessory protein